MRRKKFSPRKVYMAVRLRPAGMPVLVVALGAWPMGTVSLWAKATMVAPFAAASLDVTDDVVFGEFVERAPKRRKRGNKKGGKR